MEWQRPSRTGHTCTSYGRRAPPGCGRWACPFSWRCCRTGRTWMSSHLQQGQRNIGESHFQLPIVVPVNTRSLRTARGEPISPGRLSGQKNKKSGIRRAQTMVFRKVWFCSFLNRSSFYCASVAVISGETVNQTTLPYVSSERQMVVKKKKKKTCLILIITPLQTDSTQTQSQLFTECSLMFSFTPLLSASIQQPLLLKSGCFHYMEIIQFPQSSLERACECVSARMFGEQTRTSLCSLSDYQGRWWSAQLNGTPVKAEVHCVFNQIQPLTGR